MQKLLERIAEEHEIWQRREQVNNEKLLRLENKMNWITEQLATVVQGIKDIKEER